MALVWDKLSVSGLSYADLLDEISRLHRNTLWRHNDAGDLIGNGDTIDLTALASLVKANAGRRGFTYTHWPWRKNAEAIRWANLYGFTVNVSLESVDEALAAYKAGLPVAVIREQTENLEVIDDIKFVVCPAQTKGWTCKECGLCQQADREYVIVFKPHGTKRKTLIKMLNADADAEAETIARGTAFFETFE